MSEMYEKQYNYYITEAEELGFETLGLMSSQSWRKDPKHFLFYLSRYKFVSKMFDGFENVLEVGCGDGFASRLIKQTVKNLTLCDIDPIFIADIKRKNLHKLGIGCLVHDFFEGSIPKRRFNGIYLLDVLEHIEPSKDDLFLHNIVENLADTGAMIVGVPSLESQQYASEDSKIGHINLMSQKDLRKKMEKYFYNVFIFSMNDEVVHTGFFGMAHYMFALCANKRKV